jgi:hypothetical protein
MRGKVVSLRSGCRVAKAGALAVDWPPWQQGRTCFLIFYLWVFALSEQREALRLGPALAHEREGFDGSGATHRQ